MKSKDIQIGEEYEVAVYGGTLCAKVKWVGPKTRKVFSGARWDTGGHTSTGTVVTIIKPSGGEEDVTPQQVKRLWAEGEAQRDAYTRAKARVAAAVKALNSRGIPARNSFDSSGLITITLSVSEAEALVSRISKEV